MGGTSSTGTDGAVLTTGAFKVDADEISSLAGALSQRIGDRDGFNDLLDQLQSDMDDLDKAWLGPNHDRFMQYFKERYDRVAYYSEWLDSYVAALNAAAKIYKDLPTTLRGTLKV